MVEFLKTQPAFRRFTYNGALSLFHQMKKKNCEIGQIIYAEGKPADSAYIVLKGNFEMVKKLP